MKKLAVTLLLSVLMAGASFGQVDTLPAFDSTDFAVKAKLAEWLVTYNQVALITADSLRSQNADQLSRLGKEWFCFQDSSNTWHAVYGRFRRGNYRVMFHFTVNSSNEARLASPSLDSTFVNAYARALYTASSIVQRLQDTLKINFFHFIRQNDDKTFTVWILPALQANGYAIYGGEFIYTIRADGMKVLADNSYFQGTFRALQVDRPREVTLNYSELEKPTIGSIFFVWYYKPYFTRINIQNAHYITTAFNGGGAYFWAHLKRKTVK